MRLNCFVGDLGTTPRLLDDKKLMRTELTLELISMRDDSTLAVCTTASQWQSVAGLVSGKAIR